MAKKKRIESYSVTSSLAAAIAVLAFFIPGLYLAFNILFAVAAGMFRSIDRWNPDVIQVLLFTAAAIISAAWARSIYITMRWQTIQPEDTVCHHCGYDLTGNVSGRCPECGTSTGVHALEAEPPHEPGCGKTRAIMRTPGDRLLLTTWILLAVSGGIGAAAFLVAGESLVSIPFLGLPSSILAVATALGASIRHRRRRPRPQPQRAMVLGVTLGIAICILGGQAMLARRVWRSASEDAKSAVAASNLRGLGIAVRLYCNERGEFPPSLQTLVDTGAYSWRQLRSPNDPQVREQDGRQVDSGYGSFEYCPGLGDWPNAPDVVLAYEREAWSPVEARLSPRRARCVLFGDGRVLLLKEDEFATARQRSVRKRKELDWPVCR